MNSDTQRDKPKQIFSRTQVNCIMKYWDKCIISVENTNNGPSLQLY